MWRSVRIVVPKAKLRAQGTKFQRHYSSTSSSGSKIFLGLVSAAGVGFAGAVIYGKYDPNFKKRLEENIPFIDQIYKWLPTGDKATYPSPKKISESKAEDIAAASSLLKKKLEREKAALSEAPKSPVETKIPSPPVQPYVNEKLLKDAIKKLEKISEEAVDAHKAAANSIKTHTAKLYEALDLPEGKEDDLVWKEATKASLDKSKAIELARQKTSDTKAMIEKLKVDMKKVVEKDASNPVVKACEESIAKVSQDLQSAKAEVASVENEAKTAAEYEQLVNKSKEQFRGELQIVLPNYLQGDTAKTVSEGDLNLLIAHAHRRIEQLQKQLAKQQVTEKLKVDEALHNQKMQDELLMGSKVEAELEKRQMDLESAVVKRVASIKEDFENELRQQLRRQAAAHADHIQEVLKVQEQELERKFSLELEEKLLHQKGVFISDVAANMARLKGILSFLKAKKEFDESSKKAQALWLACQAMNYKITADKSGSLSPLGKDIATIKVAADEDSDFINSILSSIPPEAVNRGVFTNEVLKQRFEKVKQVCRKVALIDENSDSLYRYMLSYLQSFLIVDACTISKEELEGKVAVDPSEWDTFDILCRMSYCLKVDDMEQALRYANQLKGEPRAVAADWMKEVRLLLETQLAVKVLLAHAAAVGIQAYH